MGARAAARASASAGVAALRGRGRRDRVRPGHQRRPVGEPRPKEREAEAGPRCRSRLRNPPLGRQRRPDMVSHPRPATAATPAPWRLYSASIRQESRPSEAAGVVIALGRVTNVARSANRDRREREAEAGPRCRSRLRNPPLGHRRRRRTVSRPLSPSWSPTPVGHGKPPAASDGRDSWRVWPSTPVGHGKPPAASDGRDSCAMPVVQRFDPRRSRGPPWPRAW